MAEYISREALKNDIAKSTEPFNTASVFRAINRQIAADVEPVRHGHWKTNSDRPDTLICSACKCGFDMWKHDPHNFCPNCGAKMDKEKNE